MKKRIIITTVVLAGMHFILAIGSIGIAFGLGMRAFDNPDYQPPRIERIAARLAGVLAQPGRSLESSRWWTWTAFGTLVAAGVTAVVLLSEAAPDDGEVVVTVE